MADAGFFLGFSKISQHTILPEYPKNCVTLCLLGKLQIETSNKNRPSLNLGQVEHVISHYAWQPSPEITKIPAFRVIMQKNQFLEIAPVHSKFDIKLCEEINRR